MLSVLFVVALLTSCTSKLRETLKTLNKGVIYENTITINGNVIPLREGKWTLVSYEVDNRFLELTLFKTKGNIIESQISITARDKVRRNAGYVKNEECARKNVHFIETVENRAGGKQECWLVNHITDIRYTGNSKKNREILEFIQKNKIVVPRTMVETYHFFANGNDYLNVEYDFNPVVEGFEKDITDSWSASVWNFMRIHEDAAKKKYIDKIIEIGRNRQVQLKKGLTFNKR